MNYEEKYNEALERALKLRVQNPFDTVGQMVEHIFPELKEPKEEIRKVLLDYFQAYKDKEKWGITKFNGIPTDNIIAWLEKQGHMLYPDRVIKWLNNQACQGWIEDVEVDKFIAKFKKEFEL